MVALLLCASLSDDRLDLGRCPEASARTGGGCANLSLTAQSSAQLCFIRHRVVGMEDFGAPIYEIKNKMNIKSYIGHSFLKQHKTHICTATTIQSGFSDSHCLFCGSLLVAQGPMLPTQAGGGGLP